MEKGKIQLLLEEKKIIKTLFKAFAETIGNGKRPEVRVSFVAGGVSYTTLITQEIFNEIRLRAQVREQYCNGEEARRPLSIHLEGRNGKERIKGEVSILTLRFDA